MRLLLFSDLHRDKVAAESLLEQAENADVIIGAGDFATCRQGLEDCVDILSQSHCPAILVPGNGESFEELVAACEGWGQAHVLHGFGVEVLGVRFFGIGGGIPVTPFGSWSWDFTEDQARTLLADCPRDGVLVSHSPPFGLADRTSAAEHKGSRAVLEAIQQRSLSLVVCGHIHESWETRASSDATPVFNAGPRGVWFDL